ncbi:hypothetical protein [Candidatus Poriferisodalis sp.]|uniref:hypothetical protein n=1 Tax=Candidatus Poriferisodalis sp. TaxID=3101277 RepID=UPI003B01D613
MSVLDTKVVSELIRPIPEPSVATRNVADFAGLGLDIVDAWTVRGGGATGR